MTDQDNPVSWDLFYLTKEGMEAHLQLKGATVTDVLSEAEAARAKVQEAGGVARPRNGRIPAVNGATLDAAPTCAACGKTLAFREGTSKAGKEYKGYFCPNRDCKGEPVWVND